MRLRRLLRCSTPAPATIAAPAPAVRLALAAASLHSALAAAAVNVALAAAAIRAPIDTCYATTTGAATAVQEALRDKARSVERSVHLEGLQRLLTLLLARQWRLLGLLRPTNAGLVATSTSPSLQEALRDKDRSVG